MARLWTAWLVPTFCLLAVATPLRLRAESPRAAALADPPLLCRDPEAQKSLVAGYDLQNDHNTDEALLNYKACLAREPFCVSCLYEIGWSYWKQGERSQVIKTWEAALKVDAKHARILEFLPTARENLKIVEAKDKVEVFRQKTNLMVQSEPSDAPVSITFVGRWQAYNSKATSPLDHFDADIDSPKSASFSPDGSKVYVNSLEGERTVVFDSAGLKKLAVIRHQFKGDEKFIDVKPPFDYRWPKVKNPNAFSGKPVESVNTHGGRFLWVPYYRRSYDEHAAEPSAMAIVDTATNEIVRVVGTGPIAKYVQVSPDGHFLAVSHWGDNTVGVFDIRGDDPKKFKEFAKLVVDRQLAKSEMTGNRDSNCGFCVRGLSYSTDSRYLFVARMRKGGIAVFDLLGGARRNYLGTVYGVDPGSRDLQIRDDILYTGGTASGFIERVSVRKLIGSLKGKQSGSSVSVRLEDLGGVRSFAGTGVRSLKLTPDGKYLFVAVNKISELQVYSALNLKRVAKIPVDSYPVGLALSPDGKQVWVTSQGDGLKGGNSVGVYQVAYRLNEEISVSSDPRRQEGASVHEK